MNAEYQIFQMLIWKLLPSSKVHVVSCIKMDAKKNACINKDLPCSLE